MWTAEAALSHLLLLYSNQETQLTSSLLTNNTPRTHAKQSDAFTLSGFTNEK